MDKNLYKQIFELNCSFEELENLDTKIDDIKFEDDNSFEKYYDINIIINAINRYQKGEIDEKYLSYWANVYNWLIMTSEWKDDINFDFKSFIKSKLSYALDSLSFFDVWYNDPHCNDLKQFLNELIFLDNILKNIADYEIYFRPITGKFTRQNKVYIVAVNNKNKTFVKFNEGTLTYNKSNVGTKLDATKMATMVKQLKNDGYKEIK